MNVLVFDLETVPDVEAARRLYGLTGLSDAEVANVMYARRQQETSGASDFLRHHLHRVVAIAAVLRSGTQLQVWSLGTPESGERELLQRFFEGLERYTPQLVSWNGSGFDLPVLHYRALRHGLSAPQYWETGDSDQSFRWNNYLNRFHERHLDLMDVLSGYQARATAPLHEVAQLLGFPGKLGLSGAEVWEAYLEGRIEAIRAYCEVDVLNTYLVFLRFELLRGHLDASEYAAECERLRERLEAGRGAHLQAFLAAWRESEQALSAPAAGNDADG